MQAIIGIMGPGEEASETHCQLAFELGKLVAAAGWIVLTGGRNCGVMEAACKGAKENNGLTIGILPTPHPDSASAFVDIPIATGMHEARNCINILSSHIVVACGMNAGTAAEVALAVKAGKDIILLGQDPVVIDFFTNVLHGKIVVAANPEQALVQMHHLLNRLQ